jgi:hypothetical protein
MSSSAFIVCSIACYTLAMPERGKTLLSVFPLRFWLVLTPALLASVGITLHWRRLNGLLWVFSWGYRQPPLHLMYWMLPVVIPVFWICTRRLESVPALSLLSATVFAFNVVTCAGSPNLSIVENVKAKVQNPTVTSYFSDALALRSSPDWLGRYEALTLQLHSRTHPPGPILFYSVLLWLFEPERAAIAGAILIAVLASASVFAMYAFSGFWTQSNEDRLLAATLWAASPALCLIFPELDQVYPILTIALIYAWMRLPDGGIQWPIAMGFISFIISLLAYNPLVLGALFGLHVLFASSKRVERRFEWRKLAIAIVVAFCVFTLLHGLFHFSTGYKPIAAFIKALANQSEADQRPRTWLTPAANLYDFALGLGYIPVVLGVWYAAGTFWSGRKLTHRESFLVAGLFFPVLLGVSRLLDYETARVWLFLQPFVIVPAAVELSNWTTRERTLIIGGSAAVTATLGTHLIFVCC